MTTCSKTLLALSLASATSLASAGAITTFSDRTVFDAAVGATTLETFTDTYHFPIPGASLGTSSSFGSLKAGDIKAGAVYSTPNDNNVSFNIDAGGGFDGGFLDGSHDSPESLTISYSPLVSAFGFDTNNFMGGFNLTINFASGPAYSRYFDAVDSMSFFGFKSSLADITSVLVSGSGDLGFDFAIDNHAFTSAGAASVGNVPEPASLALIGIGLAGFAARRRKP